VHPSHRIEVPEPARAAAAARPDACTLCHVERDRTWAIRERARLWPGSGPAAALIDGAPAGGDGEGDLSPRTGAFGGDPIARAVSVDAIGRAPHAGPGPATEQAAAARAATLLEVVAADRYPAVRHLAARALGRVLGQSPGHEEAAAAAHAYDATAPAADRARAVADLRRRLSGGPGPDELARMARLRAVARRVDIDIGE